MSSPTTNWKTTAHAILSTPQLVSLYLLLIALLVAVIVGFELPGEYWAVLTGVVSGSAQAAHRVNSEHKEGRDSATP